MMVVVVKTGALRHAKHQLNQHHYIPTPSFINRAVKAQPLFRGIL